MKKAIYFLTATLVLGFSNAAIAQSSEQLSPTEVFCSNTSAKSGNAAFELKKIIKFKSRRLSLEEKQILKKMEASLDSRETIENICYPAEF